MARHKSWVKEGTGFAAEEKLKEFRRLVYEPEHESTTCWCKPDFLKRKEGHMEIVHHEQRDTLTNFVKENFT